MLEIFARHFVGGVSDDLGETRIATLDIAVGGGMNDAHRGLLEGRAVELFAVAQQHLRLPALGDVLD